MGLSLRQAADLCGKGRSTLHRALQSGKLSGTKGDNGEWSIDGSELSRVFPWDTKIHDQREATGHQRDTLNSSEVMAMKVAMLEQQLEREQETVSDLRKRLDRAEESVMALTDQRTIKNGKGWLKRLLGR